MGGSGGTDTKLFRRRLVLLRIYSSSAASRAASTRCESTPSPLIVLPTYPLHFSSFSLGSTLVASFSIMLDTSTPPPKMLFRFYTSGTLSGCYVVCMRCYHRY